MRHFCQSPKVSYYPGSPVLKFYGGYVTQINGWQLHFLASSVATLYPVSTVLNPMLSSSSVNCQNNHISLYSPLKITILSDKWSGWSRSRVRPSTLTSRRRCRGRRRSARTGCRATSSRRPTTWSTPTRSATSPASSQTGADTMNNLNLGSYSDSWVQWKAVTVTPSEIWIFKNRGRYHKMVLGHHRGIS